MSLKFFERIACKNQKKKLFLLSIKTFMKKDNGNNIFR